VRRKHSGAVLRDALVIQMAIPVPFRWLITAALVVATVLISIVPGHARPGDSAFVWLVANTPDTLQKWMHFFVYAALAWLWAWTLESITPRWTRFLFVFVLCVGLGVFLEWYQTRVPGRFGTLFDVFLNTAGVIAGLTLAWLKPPSGLF